MSPCAGAEKAEGRFSRTATFGRWSALVDGSQGVSHINFGLVRVTRRMRSACTEASKSRKNVHRPDDGLDRQSGKAKKRNQRLRMVAIDHVVPNAVPRR